MTPGPLPPSWSVAPLAALGEWRGGGTPAKDVAAFWTGGTISWVSPKDMKQLTIRDTEDRITREAVEASATNVVGAGSVLIVTRSGILRRILPVAVNEVPVAINQDLKALELHDGIDPRYVAWALRRFEREILHDCVKGGTTVQSVVFPKLLQFEIPIAPAAEQRRIVAAIEEYFSRIDAGVEAFQSALRNIQRMWTAILQAVVTGQLVPQNLEDEPAEVLLSRILEDGRLSLGGKRRNELTLVNDDLPSLPQGWCWATVDQLAAPEPHAITDGPFGSNLKTSHYRQAGPRVIRLQNIGDGVFVDERAHISPQHYEKLKKHAVAEGDLVIAALGEDLPRACTVPKWVTPAIVKADCIRFRPHRSLDVPYLSLALNAPPTKARVAAIIHGVGRPRLNLTEIRSIPLPLPPAFEQRRIAVEASLYFSIIEAVESQAGNMLTRSEQLRRAVLATAFDGDLAPQDPSDEPASVLLDRIKTVRAPQKFGHHSLPTGSRP